MKLLFFSDVHGVAPALRRLFQHADQLQPQALVLLGDALYHGPRNGVPQGYNPTETVELLNSRREQIIAVRGNCEAEVDQMLLEFPVMADYTRILTPQCRFFATHGHLWNTQNMPPIAAGEVFIQGHTHLPSISKLDSGVIFCNPGSISLPKGGNPPSFGFYDGKEITLRHLEDGSVFAQYTIGE